MWSGVVWLYMPLICFIVGAGVLALVTLPLAYSDEREEYEDEWGFNFARRTEFTGRQRDPALAAMGSDQSPAAKRRIQQ